MTAPATPPDWDPGQYARYADERARPHGELLARVPTLPRSAPGLGTGAPVPRIADLGCGHGPPTAALSSRWPDARITGYDNSAAMLREARALAGPTGGGGTLDFVPADLSTWQPDGPIDLLVSHAALQWWPGHAAAFPAWVDALPPGGVLAFQVPGNADQPSHILLNQLSDTFRRHGRLGTPRPADSVLDPAGYLGLLAPLGCAVDAWETTYLHLLTGEDPVLEWVRGTALRPVLTALEDDPEAREEFLAEYGAALREAYPAGPHGTPFPFRRVFVVAVKR